jgi:ABC-type multidrug transport system ATPase subunit
MIRVHNLVKKFGDLAAVDGISFDVRAGEIFAFLGPNGAGGVGVFEDPSLTETALRS